MIPPGGRLVADRTENMRSRCALDKRIIRLRAIWESAAEWRGETEAKWDFQQCFISGTEVSLEAVQGFMAPKQDLQVHLEVQDSCIIPEVRCLPVPVAAGTSQFLAVINHSWLFSELVWCSVVFALRPLCWARQWQSCLEQALPLLGWRNRSWALPASCPCSALGMALAPFTHPAWA